MNALELIKFGSNYLKKKISSYIRLRILLSKILNKTREEILINLDQKLIKNILNLKNFNRRSKNEPIAYILEEKEFWSKKFYVNKDTLIPRPETELLVEKLLKYLKKKNINFRYWNWIGVLLLVY
jgi:release factor glutamine methyltransferase